jgi:DNA polymerase III subunit gamma/tau
MTFIVTARKWRPKKFNDVVGQEHITATLKNAIKNNRIAHAYLFTGPRGIGKTTTARILAKTLNCLNPQDFEPCDNCEMCKSITNNQSMDIIEIDGASNRGIDEIRTLRDSVRYTPTKGKYKIYIIDEVHMLTKESFNAFLKTLEEPPPHIIFIFATTDIHKVPLTIISRCQRFDFRRIQLDVIKSQLLKIAVEEKIEIDDITLTIIAKKADGALRDAQSYFDQVVSFCGNKIESGTVAQMLSLIDDEIYFKISDAVIDKNFKTVFDITKIIYENGWSFIDFVDGLAEHFRNILTVVISGTSDMIEAAEFYKSKYLQYYDKFSEGDILRLLSFLNKTQQELRFSQNHKLKLEIALSHLIGLERSSTISDIITKIKDSASLEDTLQPIEKKSIYESRPADKIIKEPAGSSATQKSPSVKKNIEKKPYVSGEANLNTSLDFDSIVQKWEGFVNEVTSEKKIMLGHVIGNVRLRNFEGNKLNVSIPDKDGNLSLKFHEDYLNKKCFDFFGKKIVLNITLDETNGNEKTEPITTNDTQKKNEADPLVYAIVNELSAEEIKNF